MPQVNDALDKLQREAEQAGERVNVLFNKNIELRENNERLRTELDIVKGLFGCFSDDMRKQSNADWILSRIETVLEETKE